MKETKALIHLNLVDVISSRCLFSMFRNSSSNYNNEAEVVVALPKACAMLGTFAVYQELSLKITAYIYLVMCLKFPSRYQNESSALEGI